MSLRGSQASRTLMVGVKDTRESEARRASWRRCWSLLSSHVASRASQTISFSGVSKTVNEFGTSAAPEDILVVTDWPTGDRTVVVVGHQPTLGETAAWLMTGNKEQWTVKTGAVVWIARRADVASARTHMRALISPDLV